MSYCQNSELSEEDGNQGSGLSQSPSVNTDLGFVHPTKRLEARAKGGGPQRAPLQALPPPHLPMVPSCSWDASPQVHTFSLHLVSGLVLDHQSVSCLPFCVHQHSASPGPFRIPLCPLPHLCAPSHLVPLQDLDPRGILLQGLSRVPLTQNV